MQLILFFLDLIKVSHPVGCIFHLLMVSTILFNFLLLFSHVSLFVTPWTVAHQASLSFTISQSLHKRMSIELVMPSNHLILCHPLLLPSVFPSIRVFASGGQSIGASTSASVLPMNIQGWFSLELTGWISLMSQGLSKESSPAFTISMKLCESYLSWSWRYVLWCLIQSACT